MKNKSVSELLQKKGLTNQEAKLWETFIRNCFLLIDLSTEELKRTWDHSFLPKIKKAVAEKAQSKLDKGHSLDSEILLHPEEPDISSELFHLMMEIRSNRPLSCKLKKLEVHYDHPVRSSWRTGKKQQRIDLAFFYSGRRITPLFAIEAKSLRKNASVQEYLGSGGLGCFTNESEPYTDGPSGAMLGYIYSSNVPSWVDKIKTEHSTKITDDLKLDKDKQNNYYSFEKKEHIKSNDILVIHEFLDFSSQIEATPISLRDALAG